MYPLFFRYFLAATDRSLTSQPAKRHVFKISTNPSNENPECLTCQKLENVTKCEFVSAKISPDFTHFFMDCLGPDVPYSILVPIDSKKKIEILEKNKETKKELEKVDLPTSEFLEYPILGEGKLIARVKLLKPPCFDEKKKYPLIVKV